MRTVQVSIDDEVWEALECRARITGTSISELIHRAVRDEYLQDHERRKAAMLGIIGVRRDRSEFNDPEQYIRALRAGSRLERLAT